MWRRGALAYGALILVLTLSPGATGHEGWIHGCLVCGFRGWADAVRNLVLFLPFGFMLARGWGAGAWPLISCLGLTLGIEAIQTVVPGRDSSVGDILFNTLGGGLGLWLGATAPAWVRPPDRLGRRLALGWFGGVCALVLASAWASGPSTADDQMIGQWTPRPRGTVPYEGYLIDARVGDHAIPAWTLRDGPATERSWLSGEPIRIRLLAGPPPAGPALLLRVVAATEEYVSIGLMGPDLSVRMRSKLADLRLHDPPTRLPGVLSQASPGDTVTLSVWRSGDRYCGELAGGSGASGVDQEAAQPICGAGLTVGRAWMAVIPPQALPAVFWPVLEIVWLAALAVPLGWWLGPSRGALLGALGGGVALAAAGLTPLAASLPEVVGLLVLATIAGLARQHAEEALASGRSG